MGCTGSVTKNEADFGYMQKETLYYKIRDKNQTPGKQAKVEQNNEMINKMINEDLSSDNSDSNDSIEENSVNSQLKEGNKHEQTNNILYKHQPTRPSKLKALQHSSSRYDKSDQKNDKENSMHQ